MQNIDYFIIGGGVSGLSMGRILNEIGKDFVIVEQNSDIGGVWETTNYAGLGSHTPGYLYRFLSYPWSNQGIFQHDANPLDLSPEQPAKSDVLRYLKQYSSPFSEHILFNQKVIEIEYDPGRKIFFVKLASIASPDETTTYQCKYLIATLGNKFNAGHIKMPQLDIAESSECQILHSSDFNDYSQYKGKRIIVVGTGKSAQDILVSLFRENITEVTVLYTQGLWSMRYEALALLDRPIKLKVAFLIKLIAGWNKLTRPLIRGLLNKYMVNVFDQNSDPDNWNLGFVKKEHVNILRSFQSIKIPKIPEHKITNKQLIINDQVFDADVIVYATGYEGLSNDNFINIYTQEQGQRKKIKIEALYTGTAAIEIPNLFIPCGRSGLPSSIQSELDAMWIISYLANHSDTQNLNKEFITPFPYNFDPRSMMGKLKNYKKMKKKMFSDINKAGIFNLSLNPDSPTFASLIANKENSLLSVKENAKHD